MKAFRLNCCKTCKSTSIFTDSTFKDCSWNNVFRGQSTHLNALLKINLRDVSIYSVLVAFREVQQSTVSNLSDKLYYLLITRYISMNIVVGLQDMSFWCNYEILNGYVFYITKDDPINLSDYLVLDHEEILLSPFPNSSLLFRWFMYSYIIYVFAEQL